MKITKYTVPKLVKIQETTLMKMKAVEVKQVKNFYKRKLWPEMNTKILGSFMGLALGAWAPCFSQ